MKKHEMFPSKYLQASEIEGRVIALVVDHFQMEPMPDGEMKPVLYFQKAKKGLVLNSTNADFLFSLRDDAQEWGGLTVEMYHDPNVSYAGRKTGGIRLRAPSKSTAKRVARLVEEPPPPENGDEELPETDSVFD